MEDMEYTFRSQTETVYLDADYRLVILSPGVTLNNGTLTLTAAVRRISTGEDVAFDGSCFTWKRHEESASFTPVTGSTLTVSSSLLVNGHATFICYFAKPGLYWKDNANITISESAAGANAPYQRTIYRCAENKPATPSGDASTLPSGWSVQPPQRTNGWRIWASVAYVTFKEDNTPVYSAWSDPVEWTGEASVPIVQWQWGESEIYPPDVTQNIILVDGKVLVFSDENETVAFIDDYSKWENKVPDRDPSKPILWKREYNYQHTSTEDEWFYYPVMLKGLPGEYQSLGYIIVGTNTVIFAGLDEDKNPTLPTIHCFIQDLSYYFNTITETVGETSDVYYLVATLGDNGIGYLQVAYLTYQGDGTTSRCVWKEHKTGTEIEDGFVLAEIRMNGASIHSVSIITPRRFDAYEKTRFMELLNSENMDDINVAAEALGIERVFTRVAALEAFVNSLIANEAFITDLTSDDAFINKLTVNQAFIEAVKAYNVISRSLKVGDGDGTAESGFLFEVYDHINGIKVTPVFRALFNDKVIFQIVPSTGRIFFGTPNSSLDGPETGFMFNPNADNGGEISTKNRKFVISTDGELTVSNATMIDGTISGLFWTPSIRTEASNQPDISISLVRSENQARSLYYSLVNNGFITETEYIQDGIIRATSAQLPELRYVYYYKTGRYNTIYQWSFRLRDGGLNDLSIDLPAIGSSAGTLADIYASTGVTTTPESAEIDKYRYIDANVTIIFSRGDMLLVDVPMETQPGLSYGQVCISDQGILKVYQGE